MMESCMSPGGASGTSTFHPHLHPPSLSSGSSSGSGGSTGSGLNARTPLQSIPQPSGALNLYQVHDGFATVRKRKGPTAASIALRQQQECYDLAEPLQPPPLRAKRPGSFIQKAGFILGASKEKDKKSLNGWISNGASAGLLSTHPSLNLKQQNSKNSFSLIPVRKPPGVYSPPRGVPSPSSTNGAKPSNGFLTQNPTPVVPTCPKSREDWGKDIRRNSVADPSSVPCSSPPFNGRVTTVEIHKTRLKASASSASNSSLGRRLRRFVLPNKLTLDPPHIPTSVSCTEGLLLPHGKEEECDCGEVHDSKSSSFLSSDEVTGDSSLFQVSVGARLRNSISDNSIGVSSSFKPSASNGSGGGGCGVGGVLSSGGHPSRHFHRSCFLPKAPALEPVLEDGIPWRQTRKDVPWWELATRRGRYRSCPILQVSQQAHVVAAFEQSLSNMTQRIQSLTSSAEQKDTELMELRQTIELLRKQSIEAGLTVANITAGLSRDGSPIARQLSADSVSSINSISSACSCTSHSHTSSPSGQLQMTPLGTPTHHPSLNSNPPDSPNSKKKHPKNKGWLRSSFTKAFSRSKAKPGRAGGSFSDADTYEADGLRRLSDLNGDASFLRNPHHPNQSSPSLHQNGHLHHSHPHKNLCPKIHVPPPSPLLSPPQSNGCSSSSGSHSPRSNSGTNPSSGLCEDFSEDPKSVDELKKQLREKEMVLTDIRLEALTSAHQLESLKETVTKMRNEMLSLKQDNDRLQRMVTCKSLTSSQSSLQMVPSDTVDMRQSASEIPPPSASNLDVLLCEASDKEGKRTVVTVLLGSHGSYERFVVPQEGFPAHEVNIGTLSVSNKTKWDVLDAMVKRAFKDYLNRVDCVSNLGLSADSIMSYNVGEVVREKDGPMPELLPCGYLVGDVAKVRVCLKGATQSGCLDGLAFETLVPKSILQRYIALLADHGRIILCGPSGTGKSYLARKLGEFLVARAGKDPCPEAIATFSADHKNNKELRQYLANLAEQCETGDADLPSVIILDNLHQVSSFGEVFSCYLNSKQAGGPVIIGTMSQSTASSANLQLHHNFRWILFGNHMEPVKGLLSRYLQRRLADVELQSGVHSLELNRVMDWIPKVWQHINRFLETHNSSEVTIGPRLFLSCPTDVANSQVWFTDLWHYSIVPYLIEAVKEGIQLYGRKAPWEDPCLYLFQTYPWAESHSLSSGKSSLLRLRPEDVGYDVKADMTAGGKPAPVEPVDQDPLMNMLMRLQEAANYSGTQSNESDSTSLDSRASLDSSKDYIATA